MFLKIKSAKNVTVTFN